MTNKKTIDTLIPDIHTLFDPKYQHEFDKENIEKFGQMVANLVAQRISETRSKPSLRMSNLGKDDRRLWLDINKPELGEPLSASTYVKFLYGDILEELLLFLSKEAGHDVQGEQDTMEINGVIGHRDAVIDGVLTDVKSASSYSFKNFKGGKLADDDKFGYIDQLNQYLYASKEDPVVTEKDVGAFFVIDKTTGNMCIDKHARNGKDYAAVVAQKRVMLQGPMPEPCETPIPEGKSGNMKLSVKCSYCPFKKICYPSHRTFLYSHGPVFLTEVKKLPKVYEVLDD